MKILTICNLYPPNVLGGAEILTKILVDALREKHQVFVLTSSCSENFPSHVIPTLKLWNPDTPPSFLKRLSVRMENQRITEKVLHDLNPDIVVVSDLKGLSYAPLRAAQLAKPTVTFLHDKYSFAEARPDSTQSKSTLEHARKYMACLAIFGFPIRLKHVLSNSQTTLEAQPSFITIQKSTVVGVGIAKPIELKHSHNKVLQETNRKQVLYVGRLVPEKGVHLPIEALKVIHTTQGMDNIHLNIVGFANNHDYLARLKKLVVQYDLEEYISFSTNVSEQEKYQHFYESDVFVFPSLWKEGLGQTYLEAMSCGLPCICTAAGGAKEILKNEVNCLLFDPNNVSHLAQAIQQILSDQPLRERIIQQGRQIVEQQFSISAFTQRCLTVLEGCAQNYSIM